MKRLLITDYFVKYEECDSQDKINHNKVSVYWGNISIPNSMEIRVEGDTLHIKKLTQISRDNSQKRDILRGFESKDISIKQ